MEYRYKLRMMGIPVTKPSLLFCDNKGAVLNTTMPSSTLKKKHNAIAYHRVREAVAAKVVQVAHIDGKNNVADILTKPLDGGSFRKHATTCLQKVPGSLGGVLEATSTSTTSTSTTVSSLEPFTKGSQSLQNVQRAILPTTS